MGLPRALIVEDDPTHALIAETLLSEVGFVVQMVDSLPVGKRVAWKWLDTQHPLIPTLILLDLKLPHQRCADLEGSLLAASLVAAMEHRQLHPAYVVAITSELTEMRLHETALAGCHQVIEKPLRLVHARALRELVEQPPVPPLPASDASLQRHLLRRNASQVLDLLDTMTQPAVVARGGVLAVWEAEHVKLLLTKPAVLVWEEPWCSWLRRHGGLEAVRRRLLLTQLPERLHAVLDTLLADRTNWAEYTRRLHCSRTTYYRQLDALALELATAMNSWDEALD